MQPNPVPEDSNASNAVELDRINLSLPVDAGGEIDILKEVSLELGMATKCGLVGPSGSGKTSLLTVIAGLRRPTGGSISIMGEDLGKCDEETLASFRRENIGVVFQNFHLLPAMTAVENVAMPLELSGDREAEGHAESALEMVGLSHRMTHFPHQLSGGEQQRVAIARAFVAKPRLILADEPTGNLDGKTGDHVMEILDGMSSDNEATMLLITHNMELLKGLSKVFQMNDGRLSER